jgi:hypothetical protein
MSENRRRVVFLHVPKTAGQSVHAYLAAAFRPSEICPAREQRQMVGLSIPAIRRYSLFSGHLDWAQLDCLGGSPFVFTILRDPLERIMSFYFFLRREAKQLPPDELAAQHQRGLRAALELSPDEYFCGGPPDLRNFLDDHFDNFYTFYFAGRSFDARRRILGQIGGRGGIQRSDIVAVARANLSTLGGVYRMTELARLEEDLRAIGCVALGKSMVEIRDNVGEGDLQSRLAELATIGPCMQALRRLHEMVGHDNELWNDATIFHGTEARNALV